LPDKPAQVPRSVSAGRVGVLPTLSQPCRKIITFELIFPLPPKTLPKRHLGYSNASMQRTQT
jgi:hypothetical protein